MRISTLFFNRRKRSLEKRKGGGGGGRGGGGGSSGGGRSGGSSGGSSSGGRSVPLGGSGGATGGRSSATAYGNGGGKPQSIPAGLPFAGRSQGGGTRNDVYGTSTYGSGYPGAATQRGVAGAGFPFFFWPVVWGGAAVGGSAAYLHSREYGDANNSTRPGGPLFTAPFLSATSNTTFHLIADNSTTVSLIESVTQNCSTLIQNPTTIVAVPFDANATNATQPEQAIQYYRASSIVLALDGYNNTAALSNDTNAPPIPLPAWINKPFLDCVNQTIGEAAPLIDGAPTVWGSPVGGMGMMGLMGVVLTLLHAF